METPLSTGPPSPPPTHPPSEAETPPGDPPPWSTSPGYESSTAPDNVLETTSLAPTGGDDGKDVDGLFIGSMVCAAIGVALLIAGFIRLGMWAHSVRVERAKHKRRMKQLRYMKYLEEYSIKTGGSPNEYMSKPDGNTDLIPSSSTKTDFVFNWDEYGVNPAFISDETLKKHSPKIKLDAHMNGSSGSGLVRKAMRKPSATSIAGCDAPVSSSATSQENQNGGIHVSIISNGKVNNNDEDKGGTDDVSTVSGDTQTTIVTSDTTCGSSASDINKIEDVEF